VSRLLPVLFVVALGVAAIAWTMRTTAVQTTAPARRPPPVRTGNDGLGFAPDFTLPTLGGGLLSLRDFRGNPIVLNFWASWCVPCRGEVPILGDAAVRLQGRVTFLGANVMDDEVKAADFLIAMKKPFVSVFDDGEGLLRLYKVVGLPTTVFIAADGHIVLKHAGPYLGAQGKALLEKHLTRLKSSSPPR